MARWPSVALLLLTAGCGTGGDWITEPVPQAPPPGQQFLIFSRGKALRWRAVLSTANSVTGVPYKCPPSATPAGSVFLGLLWILCAVTTRSSFLETSVVGLGAVALTWGSGS